MHMNNQHVIEKAAFDISFGSEEEAFEQHVGLETFVRERLMAVVNEVFDELSVDGQVLRIESLEVDLGDVLYRGYPEEMENRLRERLRSVLQEKLLIFREKPAAGEGVITRDVSEMEQLVHFLTKGHLPWYALPEKDGTIDQMLRRVLRSKGRQFAEFLQNASRKDRVIKRLACQFPDAMLRDIVHLIEPTESGFIDEIVSRPEVFQKVSGETLEDAGGTKRKLWESTLSYLLVERGGRFNKKACLESMLRQMAAHDNMRYRDLPASLAGVLGRVAAQGGLKGKMLELLGELAEEAGRRRQKDGDGNAQSDDSTRADQLHERIKKALLHGDTKRAGVEAGLKQIFRELTRENPRTLLLLYRKLSIEELRRLIMAFLPVTQQFEKEVISDFIGALESFADRAGNRKTYYWQVFERLLRKEVIDFELIAGVDRSPDEDGKIDNEIRGVEDQRVHPETRGVPKAGPKRKDLSGEAEKELAKYLNEDRPVSASETAGLTRSIDLMMSRQPDRLRRLLEEFFEKGGLVGKIIDLLHGSLMTQFLHLLQLPDVEKPGADPVAQKIELPDIAKGLKEDEDAFTEEIYIENAGLVLAAPYLPRLFAMLELTEESDFKNRKAAERAVHLLQFMVNESIDSPEYQLVLNKILCGVGTGIPITREIEISPREKETIEGLIRGMVENWKIIGNTSVQGLRESFLQREGRLGLKDDAWHLLVEQRAFDMLLDQIPWSFSIIKHPWMEWVVHVTWR
jgi:hypothetical protein